MPAQKLPTVPFSAGRLSKPMSSLVSQYNEGPRLQWEVNNIASVIKVDLAHVVMLAEQGYLTKEQASSLLVLLEDIRIAGSECFSCIPGHGTIVLQVERVLAERVGEDVAGRLPIARSRLDHGGTIRRVVDRYSVLNVLDSLLALQRTFLEVAARHRNTAFITYTHMQQAQPTTFGHYLLAYKDRLQDSFEQLSQVYKRLNRSPLGAVGLSGTDLQIDRHLTASLLGFPEVLDNSRLGRDAYYQIEITTALTMVFTILNDFCTDLHIFSSVEFGTVETDDSQCSTSSIFPQKKNPYALETVKSKAAESHGWSVQALAIFRGEGSGDTSIRSLSFMDQACATTSNMATLTAEIVQGLIVHESRCNQLLSRAWVTTNRLANVLLMDHGLNYRGAHGVVARLVKNCLRDQIARQHVQIEMLQSAANEMGFEPIAMTQAQLEAALSHTEYIQHAVSHGSVGPKELERMLAKGRKQVHHNTSWLSEESNLLLQADKRLREAVSKWTSE